MRLERRAVDHINWPLEEIGDDPLIDDLRVGHRSSRPRAHMPPPVCRGHCPAGFCHAQPSRIRRRAPRRARAKRSHGDEGILTFKFENIAQNASRRETDFRRPRSLLGEQSRKAGTSSLVAKRATKFPLRERPPAANFTFYFI
jgi:hypothetical protein